MFAIWTNWTILRECVRRIDNDFYTNISSRTTIFWHFARQYRFSGLVSKPFTNFYNDVLINQYYLGSYKRKEL